MFGCPEILEKLIKAMKTVPLNNCQFSQFKKKLFWGDF
jgi:hypothetical protein